MIVKKNLAVEKNPFALEMASCSQKFFLFCTKNKILRSANRAPENMSTFQSAYLRPTSRLFFWGGGGVGDFRNIMQADSGEKKIVARKIIYGENNIVHGV